MFLNPFKTEFFTMCVDWSVGGRTDGFPGPTDLWPDNWGRSAFDALGEADGGASE